MKTTKKNLYKSCVKPGVMISILRNRSYFSHFRKIINVLKLKVNPSSNGFKGCFLSVVCQGSTQVIMVNIIESGFGSQSSNPEQGCISHSTNTFGYGMNPTILPSATGK